MSLDSKHSKQLEAVMNKTAKLLELDDDEEEILEAALVMAKNIGGNWTGERLNRQLRKELKDGVDFDDQIQ